MQEVGVIKKEPARERRLENVRFGHTHTVKPGISSVNQGQSGELELTGEF